MFDKPGVLGVQHQDGFEEEAQVLPRDRVLSELVEEVVGSSRLREL